MADFIFSIVLVNVWAEFFNGFVINGFYFLRQQCSNDAIVRGAEIGVLVKIHIVRLVGSHTDTK